MKPNVDLAYWRDILIMYILICFALCTFGIGSPDAWLINLFMFSMIVAAYLFLVGILFSMLFVFLLCGGFK